MLVAEKVILRKFDITEYGVCFTEDALDDIPESVIRVSHQCRLWYNTRHLFHYIDCMDIEIYSLTHITVYFIHFG